MKNNKVICYGDPDFKFIDDEEKELIESIENHPEDWHTVTDKKEIEKYREAAKEFMKEHKKKRSITLRISNSDYDGIKQKAIEEGIPYQTLITSIIHKYITDKLKSI